MSRFGIHLARRIIGGLTLLLTVGVNALPPPQPSFDLSVQGNQVIANWGAESAQGYRLFYAPYPGAMPVQSKDMGAETGMVATLPEGSAMYVAIQAYNQDGNGPYSEIKSFVLSNQPKSPNPADDLRFQFVKLDTPVAFLPSVEDAAEQSSLLRSGDRVLDNPLFEDGGISLTVHIAPAVMWRESLTLNFCLDTGAGCEPLLVWNDEAGGYADTLTVRDLPGDIEKSVYLELRIPPELAEKLRAQVSVPQEYTLRASIVDSQAASAQGVAVVTLPVVDVGGRDTRSREARLLGDYCKQSTASNQTLTLLSDIECSKAFTKDFANDQFGVKFGIEPKLHLYLRPFDSNGVFQGNNSTVGAAVGTTGTLGATIFGNSFNVAEASAKALRNKGKRLTWEAGLKVFSVTVWESGKCRKPPAGTSPAQWYTWDDENDPEGAECTPERRSVEPEFNAAADAASAEEGSALNLTLFSWTKEIRKGYSTIFMVSIIPVKVEAGAFGTVKVGLDAAIGIGTAPLLAFTVGGGPTAEMGAYASASVSALVAEAGVEGSLKLINLALKLGATANLYSADPWLKFSGSVTVPLTGPTGTISIYAKVYQYIRWQSEWWGGYPIFDWVKYSNTLISWTSFVKTFTLMSWGADGSTLPGDSTVP